MKKLLFVMLTAIVLFTIIKSSDPALANDDIIRLHVIANSDSDEDQQIKLKVRDAVLTYINEQLPDDADMDAVETAIMSCISGIRNAALTQTDDDVQVIYGLHDYPLRSYEGIEYEAGKYKSLRIILGSGAGRNWWCVIYPKLCVFSADDTASKIAQPIIPKSEDLKDEIVFYSYTWEWLLNILNY